MNIFKNILYTLLSIQEKMLRLRLSKTIGIKDSSARKRKFIDGCFLDLNTLAENQKQKFEQELSMLLDKAEYDPEKLLRYIEVQGTKVIRFDNASKFLQTIGENEGFILPKNGAQALYLSLAFFKKINFKTNEMFILSNGEISKYYFIYHFYNWFAYKNNILGMEPEAQNLLRKYLFEESDTKSLQLADIYKLKDAIRQDKASIEFVIKLCRNYDGAKQALNKLKNDGARI